MPQSDIVSLDGRALRRLSAAFRDLGDTVLGNAMAGALTDTALDVRRLTRLLCDRIEKIDPGFGIEVMTLAASHAEPLDAAQVISSLVEEPEADVSGLVDLLANRIGERRLYRFAPVASDVPERSVTRVEPMSLDDGASWDDGPDP